MLHSSLLAPLIFSAFTATTTAAGATPSLRLLCFHSAIHPPTTCSDSGMAFRKPIPA
ncbi:UNVERIFIED_CONTAM: hypothetical protein Sangu_1458800 [Sesamum angustifolium]|uniref:Secreted protein n=1 Tax=Sesamum angustifolium TaxID=2727405 RepID=A0AAW2N746_9LAMI